LTKSGAPSGISSAVIFPSWFLSSRWNIMGDPGGPPWCSGVSAADT
jgi:hypothetical protein